MAGRALCVGINKFKDGDITPLRGCVNDARDIAELLVEQYGFAEADVRLLLDQEATKASYLAGLDWLVSGARPGDVVVLFTSSHGSHVPDQSGDERDEEDEVLVVHDHDWSHTMLTDDEIEQHFRRLPQGATLITLWDTCHSGTLNDAGNAADRRPRALETRGRKQPSGSAVDVRGKYLEPPRHLRAGRAKSVGGVPLTGWSQGSTSARRVNIGGGASNITTLTLAACKDEETAADASFNGRYSGAFTYALRQALQQAEGDVSWHDLFTQAQHMLKRQDFDQTPELRGPDTLKRSHAFGGGRGRNSRASVPGASPASRAQGLAALDRQIGQLEAAGNWTAAAQALHARVATVDAVDEKLRTLEHMVGLYRVKLQDERGAMRVAEQIVAVAPRHEGALTYLKAMYAQTGDHARLQQLAAHEAQASRGVPQPQGGGFLSSVTGAMGSAVSAVGAAAMGFANAVAAAPVAYEMPGTEKPKAQRPTTPRCAYCGADLAAGARACPQCGAEL